MTASIDPAPSRSISGRVAFAALGGVLLYVGLATLAGMLLPAAAAAAGLVFVIASLRWPMIPLFAFALVIPIDEITTLGPFGSPGRIAAIAFVLAYAAPRVWRIRMDAISAAGWAYVAWAVLSVGWALDPRRSIAELGTLVQLFALGLLVANVVVERPAIVRPLLAAYSISAALTAVVGSVAGLAVGPGELQRIGAFGGQDPNQFAAILLPAFVFGLFELAQGWHRPVAAAVAVACLAGIILSGSRGAWVSLAAVTALLILPRLTLRRRVAAIGFVALLLVALFQVPGVADFVATRADLALTTGGAGRTDIWSVGIQIFESSPLAGVGFANFPIAYSADVARAIGVVDPSQLGRGPHDIVVSSLAELGIVGSVMLALFIVPLVLQRGRGLDAIIVQAGLASLMVDALFLDVLSNRKQVWLLIGLAAGLIWIARQDRIAAGRKALSPLPTRESAARTARGRALLAEPQQDGPGGRSP